MAIESVLKITLIFSKRLLFYVPSFFLSVVVLLLVTII